MQVLDNSRSDRDGATSVLASSAGQPPDLRDSMRLIDHGLQDSGSAGPLANAEAPPVPISAHRGAPRRREVGPWQQQCARPQRARPPPLRRPALQGDVSFKAPSFKAGETRSEGLRRSRAQRTTSCSRPRAVIAACPPRKKQMKELNPKERAELAERRQATLGLNSLGRPALATEEAPFRQKRPRARPAALGRAGSASFVQARVTPRLAQRCGLIAPHGPLLRCRSGLRGDPERATHALAQFGREVGAWRGGHARADCSGCGGVGLGADSSPSGTSIAVMFVACAAALV